MSRSSYNSSKYESLPSVKVKRLLSNVMFLYFVSHSLLTKLVTSPLIICVFVVSSVPRSSLIVLHMFIHVVIYTSVTVASVASVAVACNRIISKIEIISEYNDD